MSESPQAIAARIRERMLAFADDAGELLTDDDPGLAALAELVQVAEERQQSIKTIVKEDGVVVSRLRAERDAAVHERDFWKDRYDVQHGTVHRLEDALREAREALQPEEKKQ